jgi:predicted ribosomally synthesized peptide with SipW-like signal peptide
MNAKVLAAFLLIGLVAAMTGAGLYAYFSDTETSTRNVFTAGTLDLKTGQIGTSTSIIDLNPGSGSCEVDGKKSYVLSSDDLNKLKSSDDNRYETTYNWKTNYEDDRYLEFLFPTITFPSEATITDVKLTFEWARGKDITHAQLLIWDHTAGTWKTKDLTVPGNPDEDFSETVDLKAFGIDTATDINNLKIRFRAHHPTDDSDDPLPGHKTSHNLVKLTVTYIENTKVWSDGITTAIWTLSNMKPGDETPTGSVFFKNFGSITSNTLEITCSYTVNEETPQTESDTDPHTDQHPDEMAKYMIITMMYYRNDKVNIDCLTGYDSYSWQTKDEWKVNDANGDGKISLYELKLDPLILPSPDTQPNKITQLDMRIKFDEAAGNDFQGDTFNLTMIFTLKQ